MAKQIMFAHDEVFEKSISISQITKYLKCRRAWKYSYIDKLSKKYEQRYFTKGRLAHAAMESAMIVKYWADNGDIEEISMEDMLEVGHWRMFDDCTEYANELRTSLDLSESIDEETFNKLQELQVTYDEAIVMFERAITSFRPEKWEILTIQKFPAVELHYAMRIRGMKYMHGFIDLVAREIETDQIWEIDWKFKSQFAPEDDEMFNIQNAVYCRVLQKAGVDVTGSITYQVLNIPVTLPKINKNGTISRAKIRATWDQYAEFCRENGQDPLEYQEEMEPKLSDVAWTKPIKQYRSEFMVDNIWENVIQATAYEIASKRKNKRYPPAIAPMNCKFCAFLPLCQAELRGYDLDFILNSEYVSKLEFTLEDEEETNVS